MPKGWDKDSLGNADPNCTKGADQAGVRSATTTGAASADQDNLFGAPKEVANDPTVTSDFFNIFGDVTFDELKKNADIVIPEHHTDQPGPAPARGGAVPLRHRRPDQLGRARAHGRLHQGVLHLLPDHLRQRVAG